MKINTKQFAKLTKKHASGTLVKAVVLGIRSGALRALPVLVANTDRATPASVKGAIGAVNTGTYRRAWKSRPLPRGADIHNNAPYAGIIEYGRRKGKKQPPLKPIAKWAQRRLGVSEQEARSLAFPIARAIKKRGLFGRFVLKKSIKAILANIDREIRRELTRATVVP